MPTSTPASASASAAHPQALLDDVARLVLTAQSQVKAVHWATASFAVHKVTDELAEELGKNGDLLVEALSGLLGLRVTRGVVAHPFFPPSSVLTRSLPGGSSAASASDPRRTDQTLRVLIDGMVWFLSSTFERRLADAVVVGSRAKRQPRSTKARSAILEEDYAMKHRFAPILSVRDELVLALAKAQYGMSMQ